MGTSDTFQNLSESEVEERYKKYKAQGMSEDDIFDEIYSEDCNLDESDEYKIGKSLKNRIEAFLTRELEVDTTCVEINELLDELDKLEKL